MMTLSLAKIAAIVQPEPLIVLGALAVIAFLVYKILLRGLTAERHARLRGLFANLLVHAPILAALYALFEWAPAGRTVPYIGFLAIVWGSLVFVKIARILTLEYLFFISMKAGVPVLLVNILSLALSICLAGWIATEVFGIRLAPVLATSALISVILGLALQDTLGNLFAGVALQFDRPYGIGDWVEIECTDGPKWIGQVLEITWRSTVMTGFLGETITIPNRLAAQSEIASWGAGGNPFWRAVSFRIPFDQPFERIRALILETVVKIPEVLRSPEPRVYLNEVGDGWLNLRLVFSISDFGAQFRVIDRINTAVIDALFSRKIPVATPAVRVEMTSR